MTLMCPSFDARSSGSRSDLAYAILHLSLLLPKLPDLHWQGVAVGQRDHAHIAAAFTALHVQAHVAKLILLGQLVNLSIVVQMSDEEVLCVLEKVGAEGGHRLCGVHHSNPVLRPLFGN